MQKFGTKKIISIVSGLTITGTIVGTAVVLMNMASASNNIVGISFENLTTIYNSILNEYGSNSQNSALTELEFKSKVDDGSIRKWMLDNFSKYFISENSEIGINFNLSYENNSLMILPLRNTTFKINYTNGTDSNISLQNNRIIIKFKISDFLQEKLFSFSQLNSIKNAIISAMSNNKVTFSELINLNDEQQKEINSWITGIFGVGEVFETISFEKNSGANKNLYSISLKPKKDFIFGWNIGSSNNDEFNVFKNEIKINFLDVIEISNETLNELWNSVNQFIWDQQIDYYDWLSHFSSKDNKYNEFK
ncbi:MAG: hypothetical protein K2I49_01550, partial [Ureaplasma sp.]|nr:hypothetical protein [Ureaplasma sp.]